MITLIDVNVYLYGQDVQLPWMAKCQGCFLVTIPAGRVPLPPSGYRLRDWGNGWRWTQIFLSKAEAEQEIEALAGQAIEQPQASGLTEEIVAERMTS